jgi:hypothetical protein
MVLGMKALPDILEWRGATFGQPTLFEGALLASLFLGLWRGVRVPLVRLALLVMLVHMALQHVRQQAVLAMLAPLLLAEPFGRAGKYGRASPRTVPLRPSWLAQPPIAPVSVIVAVGVLSVAGVRLAQPLQRTDNVNVPVSAMAHVPKALLGQPVLNEYAFGGYLIFKGVKPYIDGRADMYGDDFVFEYLRLINGAQPDVDRAFKRWDIRWTILSPHDALVKQLDKRPGWTRVYADAFAVVQARSDALTPAPPPPR